MIVRKNHKTYVASLNHLVDELFEHAYEKRLTWTQLAQQSGLSYQTVRKLGERKTRYPQYRTVTLLAHAVGATVQYRGEKLGKRSYTWKPSNFNPKKVK